MKEKLKIHNLIIRFKKSLKTSSGQSVLEYSLILIVIAAATLLVFWPLLQNGSIFRGVVDLTNLHVGSISF